ncbi:MAG: hypothetical protein WCD70_00925 [Alphaproteobacteria bacterium]
MIREIIEGVSVVGFMSAPVVALFQMAGHELRYRRLEKGVKAGAVSKDALYRENDRTQKRTTFTLVGMGICAVAMTLAQPPCTAYTAPQYSTSCNCKPG